MSKISLTDVTTLANEVSFLATTNANGALIETASDNFLSLDGTTPNSMIANLDMNSNRIINLPTPVLDNDVVRLQDMVTFAGGGTITPFPSTSAALRSAISDETGTGFLVFATSPTLTTPTLTTPTITGATLTTSTLTSPTITTPTITNPTVTTGAFSAPVLTSPTVITKISPTTDDGAPLGDTTHQFSDLFLASGGVINFNAGDVTATHSANTLAFAGASTGYTFDAPVSTTSYWKGTGSSTQTADFTVSDTQTNIICNKGSTLTVTLPTASSYTGRRLYFKTLQAFTVVSVSSNVCPNTTNTPGTAILPGTAGAWCEMVSDGTNWIRMASSTVA